MKGPLVSILIPAHNAGKWLADAIQSALDQTWQNREIIVVDDGSTDDSLAIARQFATEGVGVVTQPNQGAAVARNTAYSLCQGDYIQWLDADDLLEPDKIELQVREIASCLSKRTLISGAWGRFSYRKWKAQFTPTALWQDLSPADWMVTKMGCNLYMQTDNWLVSRELSDAAGPWDPLLFRDNDGEYFSRVIMASDGIRFVENARSYYRLAGFNNVSYIGGSNKKLESLLRSMRLHIQYLRSLEDSARTRAASIQFIQNCLYEFYPYRLDLCAELKNMAADLGGAVDDPRLSWKYHWIVKLFGWNAGRRVQLKLTRLKASAIFAWDETMFRLGEVLASAEQREICPAPAKFSWTPVRLWDKSLSEVDKSKSASVPDGLLEFGPNRQTQLEGVHVAISAPEMIEVLEASSAEEENVAL
jgi:glycosyltransferase involved in cell wall biosynthesis